MKYGLSSLLERVTGIKAVGRDFPGCTLKAQN